MRSFTVGLHLPSLRDATEALRHANASSPQHVVSLPYPTGRATLQLSGIHVRLGPPPSQPSKSAQKRIPGPKRNDTDVTPATPPRAALNATVIVHAHVGGELSRKPRSYVVAVLPVSYDDKDVFGGVAAETGGSSSSAVEVAPSYDKRVLNAQARAAKRGRSAPISSSAFAKLDVRAQMEKVKLSFMVVPGSTASSALRNSLGKRMRGDESHHRGNGETIPRQDCTAQITVSGTISALV